MGNRNPYRISVDPKTGFLYWGEVGPDSGKDSLETRGPKGYDEINQAREAGNFGWPYFIGDNYAYWQYDYRSEEHTSELQSLMRISYAVFCLKKKNKKQNTKIQEEEADIQT